MSGSRGLNLHGCAMLYLRRGWRGAVAVKKIEQDGLKGTHGSK